MKYKKILTFHLINIALLVIIDNIYDWTGNFFSWDVICCIIPNLIGVFLNLALFFALKKELPKLLNSLILFCTNEIAFSLFEKRIIFFGLFKPFTPPNIIPVDEHHFIFISSCSIIAACAVMFINFNLTRKIENNPL
jgi:hypothetical protein